MNKYLKFFYCILLTLSIGAISGVATSSGINNYTSDGVSGKLILDTVLNKLHSSSTFHISYIVDNNEAAPVYDANSYDQTNNIPTAFKDNYEMHQACLNCTQQQWREYLFNFSWCSQQKND